MQNEEIFKQRRRERSEEKRQLLNAYSTRTRACIPIPGSYYIVSEQWMMLWRNALDDPHVDSPGPIGLLFPSFSPLPCFFVCLID